MTQISNMQSALTGLGLEATDASTGASAGKQAAAAESTLNSSAPSTVVVSATGNLLTQSVGEDDVRTDKVTALQSAIASGTYNVSSEQIADKLLGFMMEGQ